MKEFEENDIFKNTLETHPHYEFKIYNGRVYINNSIEDSVKYQDGLKIPETDNFITSLNFAFSTTQYLPLL